MIFYEGSLGYTEARGLPLPELKRLHDKAAKVSSQRERMAEDARRKAGLR